MPYNAIIFDLDGTLLDTLEDLADAANRVLSARGFPVHGLDSYRFFIGDGAATLIKRALPNDKRDANMIRDCLDDFLRDYSQTWNLKTKPYQGIPELLDSLVVRHIRMAVLSNKPHEFTKVCVKELLPNWPFEVVLGQRETAPPKPDPAGALEIAARLQISPSDFIYLGDSAVDMKTATAASMFPVGAGWGFRPPDELLSSGCRALINQPAEVLNLL